MGLENSSNTRKNYMNIVDGKFAIRVKEETPNAVKRTNKKNVEVWELLFDTLSRVNITKLEKKDNGEYGPSWEVTLKEVDEVYTLNLPYSGRTTNGLLYRLPNIDLSAPVTLNTYKIADEADNTKFKTFMTASQNGKKVDAAYSKDAPNGLPEMKQITVKNKLVWDDTEQMIFIEKMLEEKIFPQLAKLYPSGVSAEHRVDSEPELGAEEDKDDLPF